jgi:hypothetical protein
MEAIHLHCNSKTLQHKGVNLRGLVKQEVPQTKEDQE